MLRNELQTALTDLIVACDEAADRHEHVADLMEDGEAARVLRALAAQRRAAAAELGEHLRRLGDLPKAPDTEREAVQDVVSRVVAALSADEQTSLLEDRLDAERTVAEAIDAALAADPPPAIRELLQRLREDTASDLERLAALARA